MSSTRRLGHRRQPNCGQIGAERLQCQAPGDRPLETRQIGSRSVAERVFQRCARDHGLGIERRAPILQLALRPRAPYAAAAERGSRRDPPHPDRGELGDRRAVQGGEHVHRHADGARRRLRSGRDRSAGCVHRVGPGVAVGDEPRDRVVEVGDAVEVVLGTAP